LENKKRRMDQNERKIPQVADKAPKENRLTIMIIRGVDKVRSFRISPLILYLVTIFFLVFTVSSIFYLNKYFRYFYIYDENNTQNKNIERLTGEVFKSKKLLQRSKEQIAFLEDYIRNLEEQWERESKPVEDEKRGERSLGRLAADLTEDGDQEGKFTGVVDIKDMVIQKDGSRVSVKFKLVNMQPGENTASGYIHIIARDENASPQKEWTYPKEELKNGVPLNYRLGRLFRINRFKRINGKFDLASNSESPSIIKVLVYDQSGELILEKAFEVSNAA